MTARVRGEVAKVAVEGVVVADEDMPPVISFTDDYGMACNVWVQPVPAHEGYRPHPARVSLTVSSEYEEGGWVSFAPEHAMTVAHALIQAAEAAPSLPPSCPGWKPA